MNLFAGVVTIFVKLFVKNLRLFAFLIFAIFIVHFFSAYFQFDQDWIDHHIINTGMVGQVNFLLAASLAMLAGLPRQLTAFLSAYAFGFSNGLLISMIAVLIACFVSFYCARFLLRPYVVSRFSDKSAVFDQFLKTNVFLKTVAIRFLPVGYNLLTNLIAGATSVASKPFFLGSLVGYLPQMIIFALAGSGVTLLTWWKFSLSALLLFLSALVSAYLYLKYKKDLELQI